MYRVYSEPINNKTEYRQLELYKRRQAYYIMAMISEVQYFDVYTKEEVNGRMAFQSQTRQEFLAKCTPCIETFGRAARAFRRRIEEYKEEDKKEDPREESPDLLYT